MAALEATAGLVRVELLPTYHKGVGLEEKEHVGLERRQGTTASLFLGVYITLAI